jgi:guanylate kinase
MRRPWNQEATGMLAVNNYDEFLKLVEIIAESYRIGDSRDQMKEPGVVVLVGPSGSGKTEVAQVLMEKQEHFQKLTSYTTNEHKLQGIHDGYHYVPEADFLEMCENGEMFEYTTYANHYYGSRKSDVEAILAQGKHVLTVMDICGAMALKTHFNNVITIYIKREKRDLLTSILERDIPTQDKVNRLLAIEAEKQNAEICDYVVKMNTPEQAAQEICASLAL